MTVIGIRVAVVFVVAEVVRAILVLAAPCVCVCVRLSPFACRMRESHVVVALWDR